MIPLPRTCLLTSAMLVGGAVGLVAGTAATPLVHARIRPDAAIALAIAVMSAVFVSVLAAAPLYGKFSCDRISRPWFMRIIPH